MITADKLRELLHYDSETGLFTRKIRTSPRIKVGDVAGDVKQFRPNGFYRRISVGHRRYMAHRLVWLYVYGEWPPAGMEIDHIDGDGLNNRVTNLRLATRSQNQANRRVQMTNTSGVKGVSWYRKTKKWKAQINSNGRVRSLGYYNTKAEAQAAYQRAAAETFGVFHTEGVNQCQP